MSKKRYPVPGTSPATLLPRLVEGKIQPPKISLIEFDTTHLEERVVENAGELTRHLFNHKVSWINIDGLADVDALRLLGEKFDLHPLSLEDVLNAGQRPKTESYEKYLFIVAQMVYRDDQRKVCDEQVSMFLGDNFLITVQEEPKFDVFDPVRVRIRSGRGRIRRAGADYLAYALLDSIIDHYFPVLETLGTAIEELEDSLVSKPSPDAVRRLHEYKRTLMQLRRFIWPLRDVVNALLHDQSELVKEETKVFLRDCYDHTVQLMDLVESYREVTSGLMELYLSSVGQRTNEVVRVLTVITAIFIPLTFIAGVYGMNFAPEAPEHRPLGLNMPELYHPYGYVLTLLAMFVIAAVQLVIFRKKKWL